MPNAADTSLMTDQKANTPSSAAAWFCLRSQPKHEHIAAAHLRKHGEIEVFVPRIRFRRTTQKGPVWVTEALFPNYFFARFEWQTSLRLVYYSPGISGIVHFGSQWPTIPAAAIDELRSFLGQEEVHVVPLEVSPGDRVRISGGTFHDFRALVAQVMPGSQRIAVLLDFLGRQTLVHLNMNDVIQEANERQLLR